MEKREILNTLLRSGKGNTIYELAHLNPGENNQVLMNHQNIPLKSERALPISIPSNGIETKGQGGAFTYNLNTSYDLLVSSKLKTKTPFISVKKEFRKMIRIRYPPNLGNRIVREGVFHTDGLFTSQINTIILQIHNAFFMSPGPGKVEHYETQIGNIPELIEWNSKYIEPTEITVPLCFYYSLRTDLAYPLYLFNNESRAYHQFEFILDIHELLQVQIKKDDEWVFIEPSYDTYKKYLDFDGKETVPCLDIPILYCEYKKFSEETKDVYLCNVSHIVKLDYYKLYETSGYKEQNKITVSQKDPIQVLFWVARNSLACQYNDTTNYSTDPFNSMGGKDLCDKIRFSYGREITIEDSCSEFLDSRINSSVPGAKGYHLWSSATDPIGPNWDTFVYTSETNLKIVVSFKEMKRSKNVPQPKFFVVGLCSGGMTIKKNGDKYEMIFL